MTFDFPLLTADVFLSMNDDVFVLRNVKSMQVRTCKNPLQVCLLNDDVTVFTKHRLYCFHFRRVCSQDPQQC